MCEDKASLNSIIFSAKVVLRFSTLINIPFVVIASVVVTEFEIVCAGSI